MIRVSRDTPGIDFTNAYTITAIGERHVLAKQVVKWGKPVNYKERLESFPGVGWRLLEKTDPLHPDATAGDQS